MRLIVALILGGALPLVGCGSESGQSPVITMLEWDTEANCTMGTASDYTITVTANDPDAPAQDLTYDGSVTGCTGEIDDVTSTVVCPNAAPYAGMVLVIDDDGNSSSTVSFRIGVCDQDESCTTDPDTCSSF